MTDKTQQILSIIDRMKTSNDAYYAGAAEIWNLLSSEEKHVLRALFFGKPVWRGQVKDDHPLHALLLYKLATWMTYHGNEGYITGTFIGYAALKSVPADTISRSES